MNYAIIAAGEGSRLKEEGINSSKPMVKVLNVTLIERLIKICLDNNATTISCIINQESKDLLEFLNSYKMPIRFNLIVKSTPSSMHSLNELGVFVKDAPFVLMTTDTIFNVKEFQSYLSVIERDKTINSLIAVTNYVDDEKPLYVELEKGNIITNFHDAKSNCGYVTGGIYYFRKDIFSEIKNLLNNNVNRLRNLLKTLAHKGYGFNAYKFSKMIDVDHISDIAKAEMFLKETELNNGTHS